MVSPLPVDRADGDRLRLHRATQTVLGVELHPEQRTVLAELHFLALAEAVLGDAPPFDQRSVGARRVHHEPASVLEEELGMVVGDLRIARRIEAHVAAGGAAAPPRRVGGAGDLALLAPRKVCDPDHRAPPPRRRRSDLPSTDGAYVRAAASPGSSSSSGERRTSTAPKARRATAITASTIPSPMKMSNR